MFKFVVLAAVVAMTSAAPPLLATTVGVIAPAQAVAPAAILNSPAGAVANQVTSQVLSGVTGLADGLATTAGLVVPVGATVVTAPVLGHGGLALANAGLVGGKLVVL